MPLVVPPLDTRGYRELLAEALARIRVHNPEWTNYSDADPGVTVLQLVAFLGESLLYRANQVPDRNRLKFLQLLGVPLRPASAAVGVVTINNERGPLERLLLPRGLPLAAVNVGFVTTSALEVLPVEGRAFYRRRLQPMELAAAQRTYERLYSAHSDDATTLEFYETVPFDPPTAAGAIASVSLKDQTVDDSLWIALLTRPGEDQMKRQVADVLSGRSLTLGLMPWLDATSRAMPPHGAAPAEAPAALGFSLATGQLTPQGDPRYLPLDPRLDDSNPFENLTLAELTLPSAADIGTWTDLEPLDAGVGDYPPLIDDEAVRKRVVTWLRVQAPRATGGAQSSAWHASFSWAGINAARVAQRVHVTGETLGSGTGEPDQRVTLVTTPVIPDTVALTVNGTPWERIDDILAAPAEVETDDPAHPARLTGATRTGPQPAGIRGRRSAAERFAVDRESGVITFGDGLRGARPAAGAAIFASYAYGGGIAGNVGIGQVRTSPLLPAGFRVGNPLPTWGGAPGETAEEGARNVPRFLRHRDRAVSDDDFRDIVLQTPGVSIGRVEVLSLFHPDVGRPAPGVVTLLLVPNDPNNPDAPVPNRPFLRAVCDYLEPRRVLTTEVYLEGPLYQPISVSVGIDVIAGLEIAPVREAVRDAIREFVSPTRGGFEHGGWPLDTPVDDRELWARAARVDGVARVRELKLFDNTGARVDRIPIAGLELPKLERIVVAIGDAEELAPALPAPKRRVAVPVLPLTC